MAFNAQFYSFSKEYNSSKRPTGDGTTIPLVANRGFDLINPLLYINAGLGGTNAPTAYNYCYIPSVGRYYFIEDWTFTDGLWCGSAAVDVLATYRTEIGNSTNYVLRSAYAYDGTIEDSMYPAKNAWEFDSVSVNNPWEWDLTLGGYCIGIAGNATTHYYLFSYTGFTQFINALLSDTYNQTVLAEWALTLNEEVKAIIDPLQYITSCIFVPIATTTAASAQTIKVGYGEVSAYCVDVSGASSVVSIPTTISGIPKHRLASTRGAYLNYSPWTSYKLDMPPIGTIELDASIVGTDLTINCALDRPTGFGVFRISSNGNQIALVKAQVGVTIELSQVIARGMGTLSTIQGVSNVAATSVGGMAGIGAGAVSGNVGAVVGGLASIASSVSGFIKNAIESKVPSCNTIGSVGAFCDLAARPTVYAQFAIPVDEQNSTRGRPLCAPRQLSTLPGYQLIADANVEMYGTEKEKSMVVSYLQGGFYYE